MRRGVLDWDLNCKEAPDAVNFLSAVLVRFPEIGTAFLGEDDSVLSLRFYFLREIDAARIKNFKEYVELSWDVFFQIQDIDCKVKNVIYKNLPGGTDDLLEGGGTVSAGSFLMISRDLFSFTVEELVMLVTLVKEHFTSELVVNTQVPQDDAVYQDEVIYRSLEKIRDGIGEMRLVGLRDDMKVLIYPCMDK